MARPPSGTGGTVCCLLSLLGLLVLPSAASMLEWLRCLTAPKDSTAASPLPHLVMSKQGDGASGPAGVSSPSSPEAYCAGSGTRGDSLGTVILLIESYPYGERCCHGARMGARMPASPALRCGWARCSLGYLVCLSICVICRHVQHPSAVTSTWSAPGPKRWAGCTNWTTLLNLPWPRCKGER